FAAATISDTVNNMAFTLQRQVYVEGNDVYVVLKNKALTYNKTYYVTIDSGAIVPPGGGSFSISDPNAWRFQTAAAAPSGTSPYSVALDGSGQFCSWQGAIDAVPGGNSPFTINIGAGSYHGLVFFSNKHNITLHGADRDTTKFSGVNNNN